MKFQSVFAWAAALVFLMSVQLSSSQAQDNSAGVIQYRQKVMGAVGGHMGANGQIMKHKLGFKEHMPQHAKALAELARMIPAIFPKGSGKGKTDALPKIWQDWDGFKSAASKLEEEANKLAEVAAGGDMAQIGAQMKKVGKSCGGCHKKFRQPKEKRKMWMKKK